uniref:Uncharacterized protein n=1 Tax=Sphaerodactylus townsendi TaxID=933632 RepID=A0ACB8E9T7_9SAUR
MTENGADVGGGHPRVRQAPDESSWKAVSQEEKVILKGCEMPPLKTRSMTGAIAAKISRALKKTLLLLLVLIYTSFLAGILFFMVFSIPLPLATLSHHLLPAVILFVDALGPAIDVFCNDVLGAILVSSAGLLLPFTAGYCLYQFLLPNYFELLKLMW